MINIVFFGSSKYSTIIEKSLYDKFGLSLVITLPDKAVGRKKEIVQNPVKKFALKNNIPVIVSDKLDMQIIDQIKKYAPDFLIVTDYGLILPQKLLTIPKYAPLNIHHSLLPKYRGPTPAPTAILNGEKITGVSILRIIEQVDQGPIVGKKEYVLIPNETADSLLIKLNELGSEVISPVIANYLKGNVKETIQNQENATYTKKLTREDGFIDLNNPPSKEKFERMIRAYYPWPGVWTKTQLRTENKELKIIKFLPLSRHPALDAGSSNKDSDLRQNDNFLIQIEGKKPVSYKDFINGYSEGKEILQKLNLITKV